VISGIWECCSEENIQILDREKLNVGVEICNFRCSPNVFRAIKWIIVGWAHVGEGEITWSVSSY